MGLPPKRGSSLEHQPLLTDQSPEASTSKPRDSQGKKRWDVAASSREHQAELQAEAKAEADKIFGPAERLTPDDTTQEGRILRRWNAWRGNQCEKNIPKLHESIESLKNAGLTDDDAETLKREGATRFRDMIIEKAAKGASEEWLNKREGISHTMPAKQAILVLLALPYRNYELKRFYWDLNARSFLLQETEESTSVYKENRTGKKYQSIDEHMEKSTDELNRKHFSDAYIKMAENGDIEDEIKRNEAIRPIATEFIGKWIKSWKEGYDKSLEAKKRVKDSWAQRILRRGFFGLVGDLPKAQGNPF